MKYTLELFTRGTESRNLFLLSIGFYLPLAEDDPTRIPSRTFSCSSRSCIQKPSREIPSQRSCIAGSPMCVVQALQRHYSWLLLEARACRKSVVTASWGQADSEVVQKKCPHTGFWIVWLWAFLCMGPGACVRMALLGIVTGVELLECDVFTCPASFLRQPFISTEVASTFCVVISLLKMSLYCLNLFNMLFFYFIFFCK